MALAQVTTTINRKKYEGTAAKILKHLSNGVTQSQAALAVGVDPSYVSQLAKEEDFQYYVQEALEKGAADAIATDKNYNEIEKIASDRLRTQVNMVTNVDQLMRVAKFANEAKRKIQATPLNSETPAAMKPVTLILPTTIINKIIMNPNNEIIGVDNRTLVTLNSRSMNSLVEKFKQTGKNSEEQDISPIQDVEIIKQVKDHGKQRSDPWADL